jgi:hypothetical protein
MKLPAAAAILRAFVALSCCVQAASAQPAKDPGARLLEQAKNQTDAMVAGDYETVISLTYPPSIASIGGAEGAVRSMKSVMTKMQADGMRITSITLGTASPIIHEDMGDVALVPTVTKLKFKEKNVTQKSYVVGISQDHGLKWTFVDGTQLPPDKVPYIFPRLAAAVDIPRPGNSLEDEILSGVQSIEKKEGKPIDQILSERLAESRRIIGKIEKAGLRGSIETSEGKRLEQLTESRLKEILRARGLE